mgnify:CR=1 FL=1
MNTNNTNESIIQSIVDTIKSDYPSDIALLLIYGSYINGTANALSDVDFYFIPKTDCGYKMSKTFILSGIGYDLFPMSWERVEGIAHFKEPLTPLVGNVRIAYYNSEQDLQRFLQVQKTLHDNLSDFSFMHAAASKALDQALNKYSKLLAQDNLKMLRTLSGEILLGLSDSVAYMNQNYFSKGLKLQLQDLEHMALVPTDFVKLYKQVVYARAKDDIIACSHEMIKVTSILLKSLEAGEAGPEAINWDALKSAYEEGLSTWNKIKVCCEQNNVELAFISGVNLQGVLDWLSKDFCTPEYDLMSAFSAEALEAFASRAEQIRLALLEHLKNNGVIIAELDRI